MTKSLVDSRGLLVTNTQNGQDWDYYDGEKTGEVTAFNDIYYEALVNGASLADALGQSGAAADYRSAATLVRSSINRYLYNSSLGVYGMSNLEPDVVAQDANALAVQFGIPPAGNGVTILRTNGEAAVPRRPMGPRRSRPTRPIGPRSARLSPTMRSRPFSAPVRAMRRLHSSSGCGVTWTPRGPTTVERIGNWWPRTAPPVSAPTPAWPTAGPVERRRNSRARCSASAPTDAGYTHWSVDPHPGALTWAEGKFRHLQATISVQWAHDVRIWWLHS